MQPSVGESGSGVLENPWEKWTWLYASIWLVFLIFPLLSIYSSESSIQGKIAALGCLGVFAVLNLLGYGPLRHRVGWVLLGMVVVALGLVPVIGIEVLGLTPYLSLMSSLELPGPYWKRVSVGWALVPMLSLAGFGDFPRFFFLLMWPMTIAGVLLRTFSEREKQAIQAEQRYAVLAERERVARDVHDVLGHSLTALSVKAELASRLLDLDPAQAKAELQSIQETARLALSEVRATVGGLRAAHLDSEIAAAPRVLADAGVQTTVVGELAATDPRHRTLLGWVLREAVTNIIRHADARAVTIIMSSSGLIVVDDGRGISAPEGNGIRGMQERVAAAGGTLDLMNVDHGTRLEVLLP